MRCKYCQPPNEYFCGNLGEKLYNKDELCVAINGLGELEIDVTLDAIWSDYLNDYILKQRKAAIKINYCPMYGRKIN